MALAITVLAKVYTYFKVGAEKTDLVSKAIRESTIHDPIYKWDLSQSLEGVELDEYTRQDIQDAYTYAWYILNSSLAARKNLGLEDRFSKKMVEKIDIISKYTCLVTIGSWLLLQILKFSFTIEQ